MTLADVIKKRLLGYRVTKWMKPGDHPHVVLQDYAPSMGGDINVARYFLRPGCDARYGEHGYAFVRPGDYLVEDENGMLEVVRVSSI